MANRNHILIIFVASKVKIFEKEREKSQKDPS